MDQEQLQRILRDHKVWLDSHEAEGARADLAGLSLERINLAGAMLDGANLSGALLTNACFAGASLNHADLSHSKAMHADFAGADLFFTDFTGADLSGADLAGASQTHDYRLALTRQGPQFRGANLAYAKLVDAYLFLSDFSDASLIGASLDGAYLARAKLAGVDLSNQGLHRANLSHADLRGAKMKHADLSDALLLHADLSGARLSGANLKGAQMASANLDNAQVDGVQYDRNGSYRGIRVATCFGSPRFRRFAQDQEYIEEFKEAHRRLYTLWWLMTDCGRSMLRVMLWSLCLIVGFGLIYFALGEEMFTVVNEPSLSWGLFTAIYYSVETFTVFGMGDITPKTPLAATLVALEAVIGYMMLGILISILADKVARRS